jgi:DNA mismatch endonuclease (patch repair protein)
MIAMDTLTRQQRSERMSLIAGKDTGPELVVRRLIHGMGYRYRKHPRSVPGRPDVAFLGRRLAIFVHGCFWHRHRCALGRLPKSRLDFWKPKLEANRVRDLRTLRKLRALGWRCLVIWECELDDLRAVAIRIKDFLDAER